MRNLKNSRDHSGKTSVPENKDARPRVRRMIMHEVNSVRDPVQGTFASAFYRLHIAGSAVYNKLNSDLKRRKKK